jgi:hypothetical protein
MIRFYLGEEPILSNVTTYVLSDPEQLEYVLSRLGELVVKPTGESGGQGVFIGPNTPEDELEGLAEVLRRAPERWIAQELVRLSTVPVVTGDGTLEPRHVDLRPFAISGETITIVPGGLTRVALNRGEMIVNSSRGGGSKDTWVLEEQDGAEPAHAEPATRYEPPQLPELALDSWSRQQPQQQQQQEGAGPQGRALSCGLDGPEARRRHQDAGLDAPRSYPFAGVC